MPINLVWRLSINLVRRLSTNWVWRLSHELIWAASPSGRSSAATITSPRGVVNLLGGNAADLSRESSIGRY
jgi:hypothetical protein